MTEKTEYEIRQAINQEIRKELGNVNAMKYEFLPGTTIDNACSAMYNTALRTKRTQITARFNGVTITMEYDGS